MKRRLPLLAIALILAMPLWTIIEMVDSPKASALHILKKATVQYILIGPFYSSADFITPQPGLTIAPVHVVLRKNGAMKVTKNDALNAVDDTLGYYRVRLDETDTDEAGNLHVSVYLDGSLPVWEPCIVMASNPHDSMIAGTAVLPADLTQALGTTLTEGSGGRLGAAISFWGNVATPADTAANVPQSGDGYPSAAEAATQASNAYSEAQSINGVVTTGGYLLGTYLNASCAAIKAKTDLISADTVTVASPVAASGEVTVFRGDDYADADGRALTFTVANYSGPSLAGATTTMALIAKANYERGLQTSALSVAATVTGTTTLTIKVDLTAAQTAALASNPSLIYTYYYQVRSTTAAPASRKITLAQDKLIVRPRIAE